MGIGGKINGAAVRERAKRGNGGLTGKAYRGWMEAAVMVRQGQDNKASPRPVWQRRERVFTYTIAQGGWREISRNKRGNEARRETGGGNSSCRRSGPAACTEVARQEPLKIYYIFYQLSAPGQVVPGRQNAGSPNTHPPPSRIFSSRVSSAPIGPCVRTLTQIS